MSLQRFAINTAGNARMRVLDLAPDENTPVREAGGPDGRRWKPGDAVPVLIEVDYDNGVERCLRNPRRYKPEAMSDADHAELIAAFEARKAA